MKNLSGLFGALRMRGHISEHRLDELGRAGDPLGAAAPAELEHLRACGECRGLSIGFRRANAVLEGPWADRPAAAQAATQAAAPIVRLGGSLTSRGRRSSGRVGLRPAFGLGALAVAAMLFGVVGVAPRLASGGTAGASSGASTSGSPSESAPVSTAESASPPLGTSASPLATEPVALTGPGAFKATGSMSVGRDVAVATTLKDGRVLVTGSGSADVYDPATGRFTRTGPMVENRIVYTSTLLADGRVLIAGGFQEGPENYGASLKAAELFDPATGKFTATGSMNDARTFFSATLLPDGRVLIAGGMSLGPVVDGGQHGGDLATAELYDPRTGRFQRTGSMTIERERQGANLLRDGRVLLTGGEGPTDSAELYDPSTGQFTGAGPMGNGAPGPIWTNGAWSLGTGSHGQPMWPLGIGSDGQMTALLQDGRVLIAGSNMLNYSAQDRASAWLYDPATGKFTRTGSMLNPGSGIAITLSDGQVLIANAFGHQSYGDPLAVTMELYDPATGTFRAATSMPGVRGGCAVALLHDGRVLFAGGSDDGTHELATAVIFDPGATP